MSIYLDWAATAVPDSEITKLMYEKSLEVYGNPSSLHKVGDTAKKLLAESRERCVAALSAGTMSAIGTIKPENIIFTAGGTEADNIPLLSMISRKRKGVIITGNQEHPAVTQPIEVLESFGFKVIWLNQDKNGIINVEKLISHLTEETALVSIMHVNNETGAIQPIEEISFRIKEFSAKIGKKILFHCDGVQGVGKIPIDLASSCIDFYGISSHKLGGPKGVGLLYCKEMPLPLYKGGGQEFGVRSGTENITGIYGFSLALEKAITNIDYNFQAASKLCNLLIEKLKKIDKCRLIPFSRENFATTYSPYIVNFFIEKIPAEVLSRVMSDRGFYISAGSACASIKKTTSKTLLSMGIHKNDAASSLRISFGNTTIEADIENFYNTLEKEAKKLLNV